MYELSPSVKVSQWNWRSNSTNRLAFENHISHGNYCILALQSLNVEKQKLPKLYKSYYPPLYYCNQTTGKMQTAVYIISDLEYTSLTTYHLKNITGDLYTFGDEVKINV